LSLSSDTGLSFDRIGLVHPNGQRALKQVSLRLAAGE